MTLILTLGNSDQFIQLSDRRLSVNGKLVDDEANKSGTLVCANGRFAFGFTGIARYGAFKTQEWLTSSLVECGAPDYQARGIIERLCVKATEDFKIHPALRVLLPLKKPLSIMFSGYLYHHQPPLAAYAIVTNHMKLDSKVTDHYADDQFRCNFWSETRAAAEVISCVQRVGFWPAMSNKDITVLRKFLLEHRPQEAIIGKAVELMREMADRPAAQNTIGKQISTIVVPRNITQSAKSGYYSNVTTHRVAIPDLVSVLPGKPIAVANISVETVGENTRPMVVQKVGRNHPCPCGSGVKYKRCHGRK